MKISKTSAALALALLLSACVGHDTTVSFLGMTIETRDGTLTSDGVELPHTRWEEVTVHANAATSLEVNAGTGDITLAGEAAATTTLEVFIASELEGDGVAVIEGGVLRIRDDAAGKAIIDAVRGSVPSSLGLVARTGIGHVSIRGLETDQPVRVEAGTEAISLHDGSSGNLTVVAGTGHVEIADWTPSELDAKSGTGAVSLRGVTCESVGLNTGTSDITIDDSGFDRGVLKTGTGDITLTETDVRTSLHCTSGTGDVMLNGGKIEGIQADLGLGKLSRSGD